MSDGRVATLTTDGGALRGPDLLVSIVIDGGGEAGGVDTTAFEEVAGG